MKIKKHTLLFSSAVSALIGFAACSSPDTTGTAPQGAAVENPAVKTAISEPGPVLLPPAGPETVLFSMDKLDRGTLDRPGVSQENANTLLFEADAAGIWLTEPLDSYDLDGKNVTLIADLLPENLGKPSKTYSGAKIQIRYRDPQGEMRYHDGKIGLVDSENGWQRVGMTAKIPKGSKEITLAFGLDEISGSLRIRDLRIREATPINLEKVNMNVSTDRDPLSYKIDEPILFRAVLENPDRSARNDQYIMIRRRGDDQATAFQLFEPGTPAVFKTTLDRPGFVHVTAEVCDRDGIALKTATGGGFYFDAGAGVNTGSIRNAIPEPRDFDAFWARQKSELAKVPLKVLEKKEVSGPKGFKTFDMKVSCWGKRPVSGYLMIPENAAPKSLKARVFFQGYSVVGAWRPPADAGAITFQINALGIENGKPKAYYNELAAGELRNYCFDQKENESPETSFYRGMLIRVMRALEFVKSMPEWNGRDLTVSGGSQGGLQAIAAAALDPAVTQCNAFVPWCCDFGGELVGERLPGWRPDYAKGLPYFDSVNLGKRIRCPIMIDAGLGDYVCPPSGVMSLYNAIRAPKTLNFTQGKTHGYTPRYRVQKVTHTAK